MPKHPPLPIESIIKHFEDLDDPRVDRTKKHPLMNVLGIALCAVICGAKGWDEIEEYGEDNKEWFEEVLPLENGIPSADTFRRVFQALQPRAFEKAFRGWVQALARELSGEQIAIDGKSVKRAVDAANPTVPLHLLHVWAADQGLLLAQKRVNGAPGEIRAVQEVVAELDVRGATVTADANSCTAKTTKAIKKGGADYVLALKRNRGTLHDFVVERFAEAERSLFQGIAKHVETSVGHGRKETRIVRAIELTDWPVSRAWIGLRSAVMIDRTRKLGDEVTTERAFYVTSHAPDPVRLGTLIRGHWRVENELHWCLDVSFSEDNRRIRDENAAENFALLSRIALMLLKRTPGSKRDMSIVAKQRSANRRPDFLLRVLSAGLPEN